MISFIAKKKTVAVVAICFVWSLFLIRYSTTIQYLNEDDSASIIPLITSKKLNNNNINTLMYEKSSDNVGGSKQSPILLSEMKPPINSNDNGDTDDAKKVVNVAYVISITSCPIIIKNVTSISSYGEEEDNRNNNSASSRRRFAPTVFDGPAVLSQSIRSIHSTTETSKFTGTNDSSIKDEGGYNYDYDYTLYAFILPSAAEKGCGSALESLGYNVLIRDIPFDVNKIGGTRNYRKKIETDSCCGSKEFLKLWAYSLADDGGEDGKHEIVVHVDTDVFFVKPLNVLFDAMMISTSESSFSNKKKKRKGNIIYYRHISR